MAQAKNTKTSSGTGKASSRKATTSKAKSVRADAAVQSEHVMDTATAKAKPAAKAAKAADAPKTATRKKPAAAKKSATAKAPTAATETKAQSGAAGDASARGQAAAEGLKKARTRAAAKAEAEAQAPAKAPRKKKAAVGAKSAKSAEAGKTKSSISVGGGKSRILVGASGGASSSARRSASRIAAAMIEPSAPRKTADVDSEAAEADAPKKPIGQRHGFKLHEYVVYPTHGVGQIVAIEEEEIAGTALELFVITFDKDKMTVRVPTSKLESVGLRKLVEANTLQKALDTLKGRARVKRTMWSRRAQEYEQKINSGDLTSIAEVVRDLYRAENQPEQSYSERQLYEQAVDRMARELAAIENLDERGSMQKITSILAKSAQSRRAAAEEAEALEAAEAAAGEDGAEAA